VTRTDPPPGSEQPVGATIRVYYSRGYVSVPSVVGMKKKDAHRVLVRDGFNVVPSDDATSTAAKGTVVQQNPPAGDRRPYGSTVVISVSTGPPVTPTTPTPTTTTPTTTTPTTTTPTTPSP
jgi:eukaryotic-like serine/threonine-protein kinase